MESEVRPRDDDVISVAMLMSLISVEHQWNIELILNFQEIEDACRSYVGVITKKTLEDGRRINKTVEEQVPQNTVPFFCAKNGGNPRDIPQASSSQASPRKRRFYAHLGVTSYTSDVMEIVSDRLPRQFVEIITWYFVYKKFWSDRFGGMEGKHEYSWFVGQCWDNCTNW